MTLALAEVTDLDCVVSMSPLVLDMANPVRYARGPAAILRRVLYAICDRRKVAVSLLDLKGYRFTGASLMRLRGDYEGAARALDYVAGASFPMTISAAGTLSIKAAISLVDGRTYPLEVTTGEAPAAILALGSTT